jgi:hypothetical protein
MKLDTATRTTWTALLPDGRKTRLRVAEGVRLCVGDQVLIGRETYTVVLREILPDRDRWIVTVRPASRPARRTAVR